MAGDVELCERLTLDGAGSEYVAGLERDALARLEVPIWSVDGHHVTHCTTTSLVTHPIRIVSFTLYHY